MPTYTTQFGFRVPLLAEAADGPLGFGNLAADLERSIPRGAGEGFGAIGYEDLRVRQRLAGGVNMSVDVGGGQANVRTPDDSGYRRVRLPALSNSGAVGAPNGPQWAATFTAANGVNPRIDRVLLQLLNTGTNGFSLTVLAGVATAGATLDNLNGVAAVPAGALLLADVLVPTSATTIVDANIRDRRPVGAAGVVPPLLTDVDMVAFTPGPLSPLIPAGAGLSNGINHAFHDLNQTAALLYLPRRIVGATRIRWKYFQNGSGALVGNYCLAIFDASGRLVVGTGSVAWTGAAGLFQLRSEVIAATTFEAGAYYVLIGNDSTSGIARFSGIETGVTSASVGPIAPNSAVHSVTGGATAPSTILGFTDVSANVVGLDTLPVPIVALSVG